jgi:hypothetical protein
VLWVVQERVEGEARYHFSSYTIKNVAGRTIFLVEVEDLDLVDHREVEVVVEGVQAVQKF